MDADTATPDETWVRVRGLQERAERTMPAAGQEDHDGCWLRATDSDTAWWSGANLLHTRTSDPGLDACVDGVGFAADHHQRAAVQVCPACPPDLDHLLAARGWERDHDLSLRVAASRALAVLPDVAGVATDLATSWDQDWHDLLARANGMDAEEAAAERDCSGG